MEILISNEEARVPVTVFQIMGELASDTSDQLRQRAEEAFDNGMRNMLLDLAGVTFVSSAGLRAIHGIFMMLRTDAPEESDEAMRAGIREGTFRSPHLKLLKPSKNVQKTLELAGFDMFLEIHSNRTQALASF